MVAQVKTIRVVIKIVIAMIISNIIFFYLFRISFLYPYYIIGLSVCQEVFLTFFKNFFVAIVPHLLDQSAVRTYKLVKANTAMLKVSNKNPFHSNYLFRISFLYLNYNIALLICQALFLKRLASPSCSHLFNLSRKLGIGHLSTVLVLEGQHNLNHIVAFDSVQIVLVHNFYLTLFYLFLSVSIIP